MTILIPILYLGPPALVVIATSVLVGVAMAAGRRWLTGLTPAAQERVLMAAVWAPAAVGGLFLGGGLADVLFSGVASFCLGHEEMTARPSLLLLVVFGALFTRAAMAATGISRDLWRSWRVIQAFQDAPSYRTAACRLLPLDEPQAFVLGLLLPQVYVSQGLLAAAKAEDLNLVLAHEWAHVRRRDPLRRLLTSLGLVFHLPGIATRLARGLARTQELAADAEAASVLGDRVRLAKVLVRFARWQIAGSTAMDFASGDVEARVQELLDCTPRRDNPSAILLLTGAAGLCIIALGAGHALHYLGQLLLRLP